MPPLGFIMGGVDFSSLFVVLDASKGIPVSLAEAKAKGVPVVAYGAFLNEIVNFLIVALAIFLIVKQASRFNKPAPRWPRSRRHARSASQRSQSAPDAARVAVRICSAPSMTIRPMLAMAVMLSGVITAFDASAQAPPPAPKIWTVAAGAGLAMTSGNTETSTVNASYEVTYDPQTRNIIKSDGLLIRGHTNHETSADRLGLNARDEYRLNPAPTVRAEPISARPLQEHPIPLAPTGGIGAKIADTATTKLGD
jgi:large-conductance mechanosensitive channel